MNSTEFDYFLDYCDENGLDPETEDFIDWRDRERERWEDKMIDIYQSRNDY